MHKISSITFSLEDSHKISQPKDIEQLSYDLIKAVYDSGYENVKYDTITSDGGEYGLTGTINWYVDPNVMNKEDQIRLMKQWKQEQEMLGYEINIRGPERSGMSDWNAAHKDNVLMVYRLDIIKNGSESHMEIPEMNLANGNAVALLGVLNIPFDHSGSIGLQELRQRLAMATESQMGEFTRDTTDSGDDGDGGARMIEMGLGKEKIQEYIARLTKMVDFGLQQGFERVQWG